MHLGVWHQSHLHGLRSRSRPLIEYTHPGCILAPLRYLCVMLLFIQQTWVLQPWQASSVHSRSCTTLHADPYRGAWLFPTVKLAAHALAAPQAPSAAAADPGMPLTLGHACSAQLWQQDTRWSPTGTPRPNGAFIGAKAMLRCDPPPLVQAALSGNPGLGVVTAVAAFHAVLGLGLSSGAALVLLPRGLQADGQLSKCAGAVSVRLLRLHCWQPGSHAAAVRVLLLPFGLSASEWSAMPHVQCPQVGSWCLCCPLVTSSWGLGAVHGTMKREAPCRLPLPAPWGWGARREHGLFPVWSHLALVMVLPAGS